MMQEKNFKILLVDDEVNTRDLYSDVFHSAGFTVSAANDGLEALEVMSKDRPDIVFTGVIMPRMDGFGFIEGVRKDQRHILVTSWKERRQGTGRSAWSQRVFRSRYDDGCRSRGAGQDATFGRGICPWDRPSGL